MSKYIFQIVIAFMIGCIFCVFVEYLIRPQFDVNFEHKMMSRNGYNYCPYCGQNLYDSKNVVTVEIGEVKNNEWLDNF